MKKFIYMIAVMIGLSLSSFANPFMNSALELNVNEPGMYAFEINGRFYNSRTGSVTLQNIPAGQYNVKIFKNHQYYGQGGHRSQVMVYQNQIYVPQNTSVFGRLDRYGMNLREVQNFPNPRYHYQPMQPQVCQPNNWHHDNYVEMMSPEAHQNLMRALDNASFDNTRMSIAKNALNMNAMSTQQIAMIMREFSFDSYKLEIAKYAYQSCIDQQNYYNLCSEFTFDSNARALMNSIQ